MEREGCYGCGCLARRLADVQATVEALQAQLESANALLYKKNCAIGKAETTIEALQRERDVYKHSADTFAECVDNIREAMGLETTHYLVLPDDVEDMRKERDQLKLALDAEREKVKGLHEATKVICGHCCESMEIPSKAVLQTQLSQLQALVRALVCTMGYVVDGSYILTRGGVVLYACSSSISAERLGALLAYRATLPATPTEEAT